MTTKIVPLGAFNVVVFGELAISAAAPGFPPSTAGSSTGSSPPKTRSIGIADRAQGNGRDLFASFRAQAGSAGTGAATNTFLPKARSIAEADLDGCF